MTNLKPEDFFLDIVIQSENDKIIKFTSNENHKIYTFFVINEDNGYNLSRAIYTGELHSKNSVVLNKDKSEIIIRKIWGLFFEHHKNEPKLNSIKLRGMFLK